LLQATLFGFAEALCLLFFALSLAFFFALFAFALTFFFAGPPFSLPPFDRGLFLSLSRESFFLSDSLFFCLFSGELAFALRCNLLRGGPHLDAKELLNFFFGDPLSAEFLVTVSATVDQNAREVVSEHDLHLSVSGQVGNEADTEVRVHNKLSNRE
jgi:hypothetical protein